MFENNYFDVAKAYILYRQQRTTIHNTKELFSNLDLKVPDFMRNQPVIIGGEPLELTYGDFQPEIDIFNRALAEVMAKEDANGRAFSFSIPTYNITKDFEWDNPAY